MRRDRRPAVLLARRRWRGGGGPRPPPPPRWQRLPGRRLRVRRGAPRDAGGPALPLDRSLPGARRPPGPVPQTPVRSTRDPRAPHLVAGGSALSGARQRATDGALLPPDDERLAGPRTVGLRHAVGDGPRGAVDAIRLAGRMGGRNTTDTHPRCAVHREPQPAAPLAFPAARPIRRGSQYHRPGGLGSGPG